MVVVILGRLQTHLTNSFCQKLNFFLKLGMYFKFYNHLLLNLVGVSMIYKQKLSHFTTQTHEFFLVPWIILNRKKNNLSLFYNKGTLLKFIPIWSDFVCRTIFNSREVSSVFSQGNVCAGNIFSCVSSSINFNFTDLQTYRLTDT